MIKIILTITMSISFLYSNMNIPKKYGIYDNNQTVLFVLDPKQNGSVEFHTAFKNEVLKDTIYTKDDTKFFNRKLTEQVFLNAKGLFNHTFKYNIETKILLNNKDKYVVEVNKTDILKCKVDKKYFSKDELKNAFYFIYENSDKQAFLKQWKVYEEWILNKSSDDKLPKEYQTLMSNFYKNSDQSRVGNYIMMNIIFNSFGHFKIDDKLLSKEDEDYKEAKRLFDSGKNLDKIIELLSRTINNNPNNKKAYKYLAISLKAKKQYYEALAVLNQLLQLDKNNFVVKSHIADCYYELGYKDLALSYIKYINIFNKTENTTHYIEKISLKINKAKFK